MYSVYASFSTAIAYMDWSLFNQHYILHCFLFRNCLALPTIITTYLKVCLVAALVVRIDFVYAVHDMVCGGTATDDNVLWCVCDTKNIVTIRPHY